MRTLSAALQAAIGSGTPECKVELIVWAPHYSAVFSGGLSGRTDSAFAAVGIGADGVSTTVFVLYTATANTYRVAAWTWAGSWSRSDWTLGTSYGAAGLGVYNVSRTGTYYLVAAALQATASTGTALSAAFYNGGTWSVLTTVVPADLAAGLAIQDPRVTAYDGLYHLSYGVVDSG